MEKILKDRLNELKSKYTIYKIPKIDKRIGQDDFIIQDFKSRINEIESILNKIKDEKS